MSPAPDYEPYNNKKSITSTTQEHTNMNANISKAANFDFAAVFVTTFMVASLLVLLSRFVYKRKR